MTGAACAGRARTAATAVGFLLAFGLPTPILSAEALPAVADDATAGREQDLLRAVNDYRAAQGLARWRDDPGLAAIARAHSRRMQREGRLSHDGFRQRALRAGSALCVENLVAGHAVPEQAVAMWRRSPAHHDNLLDARAMWAGVGVAGRFATLLACATPAAPVAAEVELPQGRSGAGGQSGVRPAPEPAPDPAR